MPKQAERSRPNSPKAAKPCNSRLTAPAPGRGGCQKELFQDGKHEIVSLSSFGGSLIPLHFTYLGSFAFIENCHSLIRPGLGIDLFTTWDTASERQIYDVSQSLDSCVIFVHWPVFGPLGPVLKCCFCHWSHAAGPVVQ